MRIPTVFIDRVIPGFDVDSVLIDNFQGTYDAISYLIKVLNHKKIGYIDRLYDHSHNLDQKRGYRQSLEDNKLQFNEKLIIRAEGFDYHAGIKAVKKLLSKNMDVTAIFAFYDIIALGALRGIIEMGFKVPDDISLIGYDGMPLTAVCSPSLTTVKIPLMKLANNACNLLLKRFENNNLKTAIIKLNPHLLIRESTSKAKSWHKGNGY